MVGMVIPRIEARVTKLYPRREGEGKYGAWSLQGGMIEDSTGVMKVLFKQLPSQEKLVGKTLIFKSMEGKHGLKGLEVKKSEYNGKTSLELNVSSVALIVGSPEEESNVSQVEPSTRMPQNETQTALEAISSHNVHEDRKLGIATTKNRLTQLAGLYDLCWKTVEGMEMYSNIDKNSDLKKDIATTLFIQASREGLADKMPVRTLSKFYNEEEVKPASAKHRGEPEDFDADKESGNDLEESEIPF